MMTEVTTFMSSHWSDLLTKTQEQFQLVGLSVMFAAVLGVPMGVALLNKPRVKSFALSLSAAIWTIPSLALLAFMLPVLGIGMKPAIVVLTLYSFLPIVRCTITGLEGVPEEVKEAALAIGFTRLQQLWVVELPLAAPVILSGIRTAVTIAIGIATLAAFIGAGGLGDFINQGLATGNNNMVLLGAVPAAFMALVADFILSRIELSLARRKTRSERKTKRGFVVAGAVGMILVAAFGWQLKTDSHNKADTIIVASKNFTEQMILGEIISQLIEAKTTLKVVRKFNLGSTEICHQALVDGQIDMYPEYTGTAYLTVLKKSLEGMDAPAIEESVKQNYAEWFDVMWLEPFGFSNNESITVTADTAKKYHIETISDLVPYALAMNIGAPAEFVERADALPNLEKNYNLHFSKITSLDPGLVYDALVNQKVDVIMAFSTDGRFSKYKLRGLRDDKQAFPLYVAAPIVRKELLTSHPELRKILEQLAGTIDNQRMQQLNYQVDVKKNPVKTVAKEFLQETKLI